MLEYTADTNARVPVRFFDSNGDPVASVAFGDVTATVLKADGTTAGLTVTGADWAEISTGAFASQGVYTLIIPAAEMDIPGVLSYAVAEAGSKTYVGIIEVVSNKEVDTYTIANTLLKYAEGRRKIHTSGGDSNREVIYDTDDTTPILKFDLKDDAGAATTGPDIYEKVPV